MSLADGKMKILVVSQYFYPESFRVNALCKELVRRGHEVTVLTGYPQYPQGEIYDGYGFGIPYEKAWHGVEIIRVNVKPRGKNLIGLFNNCLSFVTEGGKWVRQCKDKYDAVYVFEVSPVTVGLPAVAYKKKFGVPMLFNVQDLWPENVEIVMGIQNKLIIFTINKIVDYIYKYSDIILCSSRGFVERINQRGVPRNKLIFWPQFCEDPDLDDSSIPKEYESDYFNITFAGNIGDAQGIDMLVEAAKIIKKMGRRVRWFLLGEGRAKKRIELFIEEYNLSDTVFLLGRVSEHEANCYVHHADCAYLSFQDNPVFDMTIPAKLQTYLACGVPILAAAGGESAQIILQAGCGIVTDRTPMALSEAVIKITGIPPDKRRAMGKASGDYFRKHFRMNPLIDELEQYIQQAIVCKKRGETKV